MPFWLEAISAATEQTTGRTGVIMASCNVICNRTSAEMAAIAPLKDAGVGGSEIKRQPVA